MSGVGFDPRNLAYSEVTVEGRTLYVASGNSDYAFWVSEEGSGDLCPFFVSLPGPQRPDGSRSVLGCTCQATGSTAVAWECIHTKAAETFARNQGGASEMTSQTAPKKKETGRTYLLLLPGQAEPHQQLVLMSGLTGWGLKVQLVEKVEALKKVTAANLRLFVGAREIPDSELVHKTIPPEQVITVEVKGE